MYCTFIFLCVCKNTDSQLHTMVTQSYKTTLTVCYMDSKWNVSQRIMYYRHILKLIMLLIISISSSHVNLTHLQNFTASYNCKQAQVPGGVYNLLSQCYKFIYIVVRSTRNDLQYLQTWDPKTSATYHIVPQFQLQSLQLPMTNLLYDD